MYSKTTKRFWKLYAELPIEVQEAADKAYELWEQDHNHPGLHFKKLKHYDNLFSVRINYSWRAVGLLKGDSIYWNWIGSHAEYDELFG